MIAEHLSVQEVEVIKDMFSLMDEDNDGRITYPELKAGLQKVGSQLGEPEIKMLMEVVLFRLTPFSYEQLSSLIKKHCSNRLGCDAGGC